MDGRGKKMSSPVRKNKVLIVDNNERVLLIFQQVLERAGFDTYSTWSGREALALLKSEEFDVLLVDDYLPNLHGSDFLHRVNRLLIQPWVIVVQSAAPTVSQLRQYILLGARAVVRKHHIAQVCEAVRSCCNDEPLAKTCAN